ncbi:DUF6887 family protein [Oscillatoria acuminata]|uniref:Uncharacterized protein n=1 Tax=Oscillatoria acuminata PCC 6304 TaxID=56110 RepID=K9TMX6_9CYAN|nr:hypothetical protein [Oscillatoria acuminata]AFY83359.1 hypothetical protein Oscil6304_3802 [Oscillatoria acuminata PCC 6304]
MNPKFDRMSRDELKAYLLAHRDDLDALDALVNRRSPDSEATWYPAPLTEETIRISEEAIQQRIESDDRPSQNFPS